MWKGIAGTGASVFLALGLAFPGAAAAADLGDEASPSSAPDLPFNRQLAASGAVTGSLADSLATEDIPAAVVAEAVRAFATAIDLEHDLKNGDRFHVRYERVFALDGTPTGDGRLLWAELKTAAKGAIAIHRFRPRDGQEQLWLTGGKAAGPPVIGLPLDVMTLTSGFGLRTDPLDHPPGPLADLANKAAPPPPSPAPKAEPTAEEKAAEVKDKREVARAYAGFNQNGGGQLGGAADNIHTSDVDRIMAERRIHARRAKEEAERAAKDAAATAAAKAAAPPVVAALPPEPPPKLYMHEGLDLLANIGTPIHAAADGTVIGAGPNGGYGNWISLSHGDHLTTVYGHLSRFAPGMETGAAVSRGDVIGYVGSTGRSTGAHLHFELLVDKRPVDPHSHPLTRPAQLAGADLARFNRQVATELAQRDREDAAPNLASVAVLPSGGNGHTAF